MRKELKNEMFKMGVLAALVAVAMPELSFAQGADLAAVAEGLGTTQANRVPYVVNFLGYTIGTVMMLSGALSLKKHTENPAGEPLNKGLGRLLVGAAITSIPAVLSVMQSTSQINTQTVGGMDAFTNAFTY